MNRRLARFACVGALVTALDVAVAVVGRLTLGLPVIAADAVAITLAASLSWTANRWFTFTNDPRVAWVQEPGSYVRVAVLAGTIDIVTMRTAVIFLGADSVKPLVAAKVLGVGLAAVVRVVAYRAVLFRVVRAGQGRPAHRPPPPGDGRLTVVVPAYREADRIAGTVARLREALVPAGGAEIVVVDDGSGDGTSEQAWAAGADQVVTQPANAGKGAAVRAGVLASRGRTVAFTDADLSYPPGQVLRLLAAVEDGWDMVVGSRRHVDTTTLVRARRLRDVGGRVFNLLTLAVLLGQYRDTQCGLKAFRSDVAHLLFSRCRIDGFAFDVELFHLAERHRLTLLEVPVELASSHTSTVRLARHAAEMARDLVRIRATAFTDAYDVPDDEVLPPPSPTRPAIE